MSFCGYATYLYKSRYGYPEKRQENKLPKSNQDNDFIKKIYSVKPETGNIDYFRCDCKNFPEYKPTEIKKQLQIDSEGIIRDIIIGAPRKTELIFSKLEDLIEKNKK